MKRTLLMIVLACSAACTKAENNPATTNPLVTPGSDNEFKIAEESIPVKASRCTLPVSFEGVPGPLDLTVFNTEDFSGDRYAAHRRMTLYADIGVLFDSDPDSDSAAEVDLETDIKLPINALDVLYEGEYASPRKEDYEHLALQIWVEEDPQQLSDGASFELALRLSVARDIRLAVGAGFDETVRLPAQTFTTTIPCVRRDQPQSSPQ